MVANMMVSLYARVSTRDKDQNPEVQLVPMREYCRSMGWEIYREYVDQAPAADLLHRVEWTRLMKDASMRKFDVLLVWKTDRAFRLASNALNTLETLGRYNVNFRSYTEPSMDTGSPAGKMMFAFLSIWAEVERDGLRERVNAGMDYARTHGTKSGLPIGRPASPLTITNVCSALLATNWNYNAAARLLTDQLGRKIGSGLVFQRFTRTGLSKEEFVRQYVLKESG